MTTEGKAFEPFVPRLARRLFLPPSGPPREPRAERLYASVLFADVTGFSGLVERLSAEGERGAERVQEILGQCFGPLTEHIEAGGGEVLKFPGDAALALWTAPDEEALAEAVCAAARTGLDVQQALDRLPVGEGIELQLRIAIGAGSVWAACVGGVEGRWELVVSGPPIEQLEPMLARTRPGEVTLSPQAAAVAGDRVSGESLQEGLRVQAVAGAAAFARPDEPPREQDALRAYVSRSVQARLGAGQGDWLSEFRRVSVVFVNVLGLGRENGDLLERLQALMTSVQTVVVSYGGSVNQIVDDEKGVTLVIGFGLALHVHEDDPARAVLAALEIRDALEPIGLDARIGITTERVFTGYRGSPRRQEYALIGDGVNVAARLMRRTDGILCDAATRAGARTRVLFESLPPIRVKGRSEVVQIFRPGAPRPASSDDRATAIIGREGPRKLLATRLAELERSRQGGALLIEGDAGIGKSRLVQDLLERAQTSAVRTLRGAADSIEQSTAYLAWRPVVASILGPGCDSPDLLKQRLVELLGKEEAARGAFLNPVLPLPLAETESNRNMAAAGRAEATRDLMISLLRCAAEQSPLLVVLEDGHWMDSASWDLAEAAVRRVEGLLLVTATRPMTEGSREYQRLRSGSSSDVISLDVLGPDEALALVCRRLDADSIPSELASLIYQRAEGHPFFTEQLALALRDQGHLSVQDGECRLVAGLDQLASLQFPDTVNGVVTARIDRLDPEAQLTLKVASVLGRRFDREALEAIHPLESQSEELSRQLGTMAHIGLVRPDATGYRFRHALIRDTAYELLPFAQRRALHESAAQWIEHSRADELEGWHPLLAHHYERAENVPKAVHYLERAGEHALLHDYANVEAAQYFERLLAIDAGASEEQDPGETFVGPMGGEVTERDLRRARWERLLAHARFNEGFHERGLPHIERSLGLLGLPIPKAGRSAGRIVLTGVLKLLLRAPPEPATHDEPPLTRQALLETVNGCERYARACYPLGRTVQGMAVAFRALPLAERLGPGPELCLLYSNFANVAAMCLRLGRAHEYTALALSIAERAGDPFSRATALSRAHLYQMANAEWEAEKGFHEAVEILERIGNHYEWEEASSILSRIEFMRGEYEACLARCQLVLERAEATSASLIHQLWALASIGDAHLQLGHLDETIYHAEAALQLADHTGTPDPPTRFQAHGLLLTARLRRDGLDAASLHLEPALEAMGAGGWTGFAAQSGFRGLAEGLSAVAERDGARAHAVASRRLTRIVALTARTHWAQRPLAAEIRAEVDLRRGRRRRARRGFRAAIRIADEMGLPFEGARARKALARALPEADDERVVLTEAARRVFASLGAEDELRLLDRAP